MSDIILSKPVKLLAGAAFEFTEEVFLSLALLRRRTRWLRSRLWLAFSCTQVLDLANCGRVDGFSSLGHGLSLASLTLWLCYLSNLTHLHECGLAFLLRLFLRSFLIGHLSSKLGVERLAPSLAIGCFVFWVLERKRVGVVEPTNTRTTLFFPFSGSFTEKPVSSLPK